MTMMAYLILILALLAAVGAGVLFYLDAQRRSADAGAPTPQEDLSGSEVAEPAEEDNAADDSAEEIEDAEFEDVVVDPAPAPAPPSAETAAPPAGAEQLGVSRPAGDSGIAEAPDASAEEPEPEPQPKPAPAPIEEPEPPADEEEPGAPGDTLNPGEDEPHEERPRRRPQPHRASGLQLPGATRRERRQWAEEKGFAFSRRDDYLVDEWTRGAAATGAAARDIVSGWAYDHEMLLMDLGGVNVMAMRTGWNTNQVVDFRRHCLTVEEASTDLVEVQGVGDFTVYGSDAGVVQRMIDIRVETALEQLPGTVTAVWIESDWVLAQTARGSRGEDWDAMLAPLALLGDAARVLPPRTAAGKVLPVEDFTASRRMPAAPAPSMAGEAGAAEDGGHDSVDTPPVLRPEEPLELPSRANPQARGVVAPRALGGDEVDAIADGAPARREADGTRVLRDLSDGSTIFDDARTD